MKKKIWILIIGALISCNDSNKSKKKNLDGAISQVRKDFVKDQYLFAFTPTDTFNNKKYAFILTLNSINKFLTINIIEDKICFIPSESELTPLLMNNILENKCIIHYFISKDFDIHDVLKKYKIKNSIIISYNTKQSFIEHNLPKNYHSQHPVIKITSSDKNYMEFKLEKLPNNKIKHHYKIVDENGILIRGGANILEYKK